MELFKKPAWLKPELNEPIYWLHLLILSTVALWALNFILNQDMFSWKNVFVSIPFLALGDGIAHTILKLD